MFSHCSFRVGYIAAAICGVTLTGSGISLIKEDDMKRIVFAVALAGISAVAASSTSIAAPIAPLPAAVTENTGQVIQAYYYHHHHYPY